MTDDLKKRLLDCVPDTWLDPLLTGPDKVIGQPLSNGDLQRVCTAIKDRIAAVCADSARVERMHEVRFVMPDGTIGDTMKRLAASEKVIQGLARHLPALWGNDVVEGQFYLKVDADAMQAALDAFPVTDQEGSAKARDASRAESTASPTNAPPVGGEHDAAATLRFVRTFLVGNTPGAPSLILSNNTCERLTEMIDAALAKVSDSGLSAPQGVDSVESRPSQTSDAPPKRGERDAEDAARYRKLKPRLLHIDPNFHGDRPNRALGLVFSVPQGVNWVAGLDSALDAVTWEPDEDTSQARFDRQAAEWRAGIAAREAAGVQPKEGDR